MLCLRHWVWSNGIDNGEEYQEFTFSSIIFTEEKLDSLPKGYSNAKLKLGEVEINAYQDNSNLNFYLIKGLNIETGITSLYQYDSKENTLQIFNDSQLKQNKELTKKNDIYLYTIIGLIGVIAISCGVMLTKTLKNEKKNSKEKKEEIKIKEKVKEEPKEEVKETIIEEESLTQKIKKVTTKQPSFWKSKFYYLPNSKIINACQKQKITILFYRRKHEKEKGQIPKYIVYHLYT